MPSKKKLLICIVGPTAIGKTSLSIKIAKAFSTEIVSADSRQFYKEMKIGTAVPSAEELKSIPHHFIQTKSVKNDYTVGDFEKEALLKIDDLFRNRSVTVLVGGSGLYVDAITKGFDKFPEVPSEIRERLNNELKLGGLKTLQEELEIIDPLYFQKVDINNPHRIIRALEIYRSSGRPYTSFLKNEKDERNFEIIYIGLTADREIVYNRINNRVDCMIADGLIDEAKELYELKDLNALQTVGYRELFQYFDGIFTKEEAIEEIKKNTRRFAKRQSTWFRKNEQINWFNYLTNPNEIIEFIRSKNAR